MAHQRHDAHDAWLPHSRARRWSMLLLAAKIAAALGICWCLELLCANFSGGAIQWILLRSITAWTCVEMIWWMYMRLYMVPRFRRETTPPKMTREERRLLWQRCLQWSGSSHKQFCAGWFFDAPFEKISKEDCEKWLAWGLWGLRFEELSSEDRIELNQLIEQLESRIGRSFSPKKQGHEEPRCGTYTLDPFPYNHYPLFVYIVTNGVFVLMTTYALWKKGFSRVKSKGTIQYWIRKPPGSQGKTPIIFVHGVGVGYLPYLKTIDGLIQMDAPIMLVELPYIAMQACSEVPDIQQSITSIREAMAASGFSKGLFIGHSFGTNIVSWMLQYAPECVESCVLVDPVVLMLHLRDALFEFVYASNNRWDISSILRTEPFIVHTIRRHFWWYKNILWAEDINVPSLVVLSEQDAVVPSRHIWNYYSNVRQDKNNSHHVACMLHGLEHGGFIRDAGARTLIISKIRDLWMLTQAETSLKSLSVPRKLRDGSRSSSEMSCASTAMGSHSSLEDLMVGMANAVPSRPTSVI